MMEHRLYSNTLYFQIAKLNILSSIQQTRVCFHKISQQMLQYDDKVWKNLQLTTVSLNLSRYLYATVIETTVKQSMQKKKNLTLYFKSSRHSEKNCLFSSCHSKQSKNGFSCWTGHLMSQMQQGFLLRSAGTALVVRSNEFNKSTEIK